MAGSKIDLCMSANKVEQVLLKRHEELLGMYKQLVSDDNSVLGNKFVFAARRDKIITRITEVEYLARLLGVNTSEWETHDGFW